MAGEYRGLNITHRELIKENIEKFLLVRFSDVDMGEVDESKLPRVRYNFEFDGETGFLDCFFNGGGTTTIQPTNGKHQDLKIEMADFLKKELVVEEGRKSSLTVRNIKKEDFSAFLELISEKGGLIEFAEVTPQSTTDKSIDLRYEIIGIQGDKVYVTYFKNRTVFVQGKALRTFNELASVLSELFLEPNQIVDVFNDTFKTEVSKSEVEKDFDTLMCDCKDKLSKKLTLVIKQAIYNTKIEGEMYDYTFLIHSVLRALEGHIKYVAKEKGLCINNKRIGSMFRYNEDENKHYLKEDSKVNEQVKAHLEKQYVCYKEQRNVYFHWEDLAPIDATKLIENKTVANQMIFDILRDINYYYTIS